MSPTLELIYKQHRGVVMSELQDQSELERLRIDNNNLRRKLAMLTAQYIWTEGGSLAKIDMEIRQYGFRLAKMDSGHDPKIVPITKAVKETEPRDSEPRRTETVIQEKRAGRVAEPHEGRT